MQVTAFALVRHSVKLPYRFASRHKRQPNSPVSPRDNSKLDHLDDTWQIHRFSRLLLHFPENMLKTLLQGNRTNEIIITHRNPACGQDDIILVFESVQ